MIGLCRSCGRSFKLRKDGYIPWHRANADSKRTRSGAQASHPSSPSFSRCAMGEDRPATNPGRYDVIAEYEAMTPDELEAIVAQRSSGR